MGNSFTFVNTGADGQNNLTISPNASDGIAYITAVDNKDLINTQTTSKVGDHVTLSAIADANTSVVFWSVTSIQGVWAKES